MSKASRHHQGTATLHNSHTPAWMRLHHDWRFWVAFILMFGAMIIYLASDDLARRPGALPHGPPPPTVGQE